MKDGRTFTPKSVAQSRIESHLAPSRASAGYSPVKKKKRSAHNACDYCVKSGASVKPQYKKKKNERESGYSARKPSGFVLN